jgi:hypothetical protein
MDMATGTFTTDTRNVYQRKLAIMRRCQAIAPDSQYDATSKATGARVQFPYLSVQYISNELRQFCCEEGLDCTVSVVSDQVVIELTNVDEPKDRITATWPLVPNDKAWAYSVKYALIRTFLIGDGTEGDEAENAERSGNHRATSSGAGASPSVSAPTPSTARQAASPAYGKGSHCVFCKEMGYLSSTGLVPTLWIANKGPMAGSLQCNGRTPDGGYANHPAPVTSGEEEAAAQAAPFDFNQP